MIPPELWDHIIDFLWTDPPALLSCALTCSAWFPASQLHLRRPTTLTIRNATMLKCIAGVLCSRSARRLFELVNTLRIVDDPARPFVRSFPLRLRADALRNLTRIVMENVEWTTPAQEPHPRFFQCLLAFENVHTVELDNCRIRRTSAMLRIIHELRSLRPLSCPELSSPLTGGAVCVHPTPCDAGDDDSDVLPLSIDIGISTDLTRKSDVVLANFTGNIYQKVSTLTTRMALARTLRPRTQSIVVSSQALLSAYSGLLAFAACAHIALICSISSIRHT